MNVDEHYRLLFERNLAGVYRTTVGGRVVDCNAAFVRILGYASKDEVLNTNASEFFYDRSDRSTFVKRLIEEKSLNNFECQLKRKDGKPVWILENVNLIEEGHADGILEGTLIDISKHKETEQALRASEARSRAMLKALPDLMFRHTREGTYVDFSAPRDDMLAVPPKEIIGKNVRDLPFPSSLVERILSMTQRALETGKMQTFEYELETPLGMGVFEARLVPCEGEEVVSIVRDMTLTRKLEEHIQQTQKMEALGTLAGGIAHDFNNLLMGIHGHVSLMLLDLSPGHPFHDRLRNVEQQVTKGSDLTRQLLGVARGGKYVVKPLDFNDILKNTADMFGRTKKEIEIDAAFQDDLWSVEVDQGQMEQVLLNVLVNAWQAMPDGGTIFLKSQNLTMDAQSAQRLSIDMGRYIRVSITDTGTGMDKTTLKRVFEPFFSTKEMGRGTGLGLASAYGIVKNHGGMINLYSELGQGTTVNIYLPASDKGVVEEPAVAKTLLRGVETVLFVDDETMIVEVTREMLKQLGYRVFTASSGAEALDVMKQCGGEIDLVILDMVMPAMGGAETYGKLREINDDVKVLLSSGYSLNGKASEIMNRGCNGFIQKPFDMAQLSLKIRQILD